ncbi:MAG: hypothetical protein SXV54_08170, partial [Chloroflexota bacterium]|nr:hypothetical protein [Chloroflexota bacterium]
MRDFRGALTGTLLRASRASLPWFNGLLVVSLLLTLTPLPVQATTERPGVPMYVATTSSISPDWGAATIVSFAGVQAAPSFLSRDALETVHDSDLAVLPAWWSVATRENDPASQLFPTNSEWLYVADVYDYTTDSTSGHEWIGTTSSLIGPPDGVKFGADSGPYQGSDDWVYLDLGTSVPWDGAEWVYSLSDGLGSVRQLADADGHVVQWYDYSPFGRVL